MTSVPFAYYRTPLILLAIVIFVCIAAVVAPPAGRPVAGAIGKGSLLKDPLTGVNP
jgi:hypothetical protein